MMKRYDQPTTITDPYPATATRIRQVRFETGLVLLRLRDAVRLRTGEDADYIVGRNYQISWLDDTDVRHEILHGLPIMPVPVLAKTALRTQADIDALIRPSLYKTPNWRDALATAAMASNSRAEMVDAQTEDSDLAEGLYLKHETDKTVQDRFKFVRADFVQTLHASGGHWLDRPILPNGLAEGVDIFATTLGVKGAYDDPHA